MTATGPPVAERLAHWACELVPNAEDRALADRSLIDTVAVALAATRHPIRDAADALVADLRGAVADSGRWAVLSHVLDFDDLHMPSTTHISTICVPVALATAGGDGELAARAYLAGGGVMARLGSALGWEHYTRGWHATTTAGAPGAAVTAGIAMGLDEETLATALALSIPAAGGMQRAFGTDAKSLQVGMAAAAGVRAARLAAAGPSADPRAVEHWLAVLGGDVEHPQLSDPASKTAAIPGGLAIKVYPACYALQRPISAVREAAGGPISADLVESVLLTTPRGTVQPLVHHRPRTGLEGKFSLEYAAATALLDDHSGFRAFDDEAVARGDAQRIIALTDVALTDAGGDGLLDGEVYVEVHTTDGREVTARLELPPGSPHRPPSAGDMRRKWRDCLVRGGIVEADPMVPTWVRGAALLAEHLGDRPATTVLGTPASS